MKRKRDTTTNIKHGESIERVEKEKNEKDSRVTSNCLSAVNCPHFLYNYN